MVRMEDMPFLRGADGGEQGMSRLSEIIDLCATTLLLLSWIFNYTPLASERHIIMFVASKALINTYLLKARMK